MKEALDDYSQALYAVLAFVNEIRWDSEKRELRDLPFEIGRRFTTSNENKIAPSTPVTPDCAIQRAEDDGIVAEAKLGFPQNRDFWDDDVRQLQKYDDDLTGWWTRTERLQSHDLVALVPFLRAVDFAEHVARGEAEGKWSFQRRIATVGFQRLSGPEKTWVQIMRLGGRFADQDLDERLRRPCQISWQILLEKYGDRKFLDHPPRLPITLQIIWDDLFIQYAAKKRAESEDAQGYGVIEPNVTVGQVTRDLQAFYGFSSSGPRSPEIPRAKWIKEALDALVEFKMAEERGDGDYVIRYKRQRGDMLERFGRLCFKRRPKPSPEEGQGELRFE